MTFCVWTNYVVRGTHSIMILCVPQPLPIMITVVVITLIFKLDKNHIQV